MGRTPLGLPDADEPVSVPREILKSQRMNTEPLILKGDHIHLEPLTLSHERALVEVAADGQLWNLEVTFVPTEATMAAYIETALSAQAQGRELPFVIVHRASSRVCGTTRYRSMEPAHRRLEIGATWLGASWQRTVVNTEAKFLLLSHAFEQWSCLRVEFITDVLNQGSRKAIERLGAKQEGILRNHLLMPNGRRRDSVVFSIIEQEWPEVKAQLRRKLSV